MLTLSPCHPVICETSPMLIHQNRVAIGIDHDKAGGATRRFIGFAGKGNALRFELPLEFPHIGKGGQRLCIAVPARVEGQEILEKRYTVIKRLGSGAFGEIFKGKLIKT